jgi:hypothetical protein
MDTDPDRLDVFDCVVEAVMVCVGLIEPVIRGVEVPQGLPDMVFDNAADLVCVTETVLVLDAEVEAVLVVETVVVLVGKAEKEDDPEYVFCPDPVGLHVLV